MKIKQINSNKTLNTQYLAYSKRLVDFVNFCCCCVVILHIICISKHTSNHVIFLNINLSALLLMG